jgi:hypothetical protein
MAAVCRARACADPLGCSAGTVGGRGLLRADVAVAPLGLRRQAAPGVRGFPGLTPTSCQAGVAPVLESALPCAALG